MKTILLTAFEPFGGDEQNASREVLCALPEEIGGVKLEKRILPVEFGKAAELAIDAARQLRPDAIVCLGQAGGRSAVTPERVAINFMDAAIPDNAGFQPREEPVIPGGPAAYFATLPLKAMTEALRSAGVPAQISHTAGTYVCNSLMYAVLHYAAEEAPHTPCGFIHLPYLAEQRPGKGVPGLAKESVVKALAAALAVLTG